MLFSSICGLAVALTTVAGPAAGAENLVPNGSFEEGADGWNLADGTPKFPSMGSGSVVRDHACDGKAAYHYEKVVAEKWYPQLWTQPIAVEPGGYYEASAMVDARGDFSIRHTFRTEGNPVKRSKSFPATEGWQRVSIRFQVPENCRDVTLGFQMNEHRGTMWIDDVRLGPTEPFEEDFVDVSKLPGGKPADRIHRLAELAARTHLKPFDLVRSADGSYPSERVVFRDTSTDATLWKMSWNPGYNRHHYSNVPVWNADGSKLVLRSVRDSRSGSWLVEADGRRWTFFGPSFEWSPVDPNKAYVCDGSAGEISELDIRTGKSKLLWKLPLEHGSLHPVSKDGKKLLITDKRAASGRSFAWLVNTDGSGEPQRLDLGTVFHQAWFLKRPDYSFMFNDEKTSPKTEYQDNQWVCEPAKGGAIRLLDDTHFTHAGVSPSGQRVALHRGGILITDVDSGKSRLAAVGRGGHLSWECDDRWLVATMGNQIVELWVDKPFRKKSHRVCVPNTQLGYSTYYTEAHLESSPDGTKIGYASSMLGDCDFYVAVQRLPDPPQNVRLEGRRLTWDPPQRARELAGYGIYQDGRLLGREPITDREFTVPDPASRYTVVAVEHSGLQSACDDHDPPAPPARLRARPRSPCAIELTWNPAEDLDVAYYNVYAASEGTLEPVQDRRLASPTEPRMIDWGLRSGTDYRYLVTAVDRAGNESRPSEPISVQTPAIKRFLAEVPVHQTLAREAVRVDFTVPRDDTYVVWVQLQAKEVALGQSIQVRLDSTRPARWKPTWDFVCIAHGDPEPVPFFDLVKTRTADAVAEPRMPLAAGRHQVSFTLPRGTAEILSLSVTNDQGYVPAGITSFLAERPRSSR